MVEKLLGPAVEEISIAPAVVKTISGGPIDQEWVKALGELERRSKVIDGKIKGPEKILAVTDIKPLLNDLTNKVGISSRFLIKNHLLTSQRLLNGYEISWYLKLKL